MVSGQACKVAVTDPLTYVSDPITLPAISPNESDAVRQACRIVRASAVPARGVATRSRAALGIPPGRHYDRSARSFAALWLAGLRVTPA